MLVVTGRRMQKDVIFMLRLLRSGLSFEGDYRASSPIISTFSPGRSRSWPMMIT